MVTQVRRDPEATKRKLLDAAAELFGQKGLEGARIDEVAGLAAVNKRMIYHYFGSKEGLFEAVVAATLEAEPNITRHARLMVAEADHMDSQGETQSNDRSAAYATVIETLSDGGRDRQEAAAAAFAMFAVEAFAAACPQYPALFGLDAERVAAIPGQIARALGGRKRIKLQPTMRTVGP